MSFQRSLSTRPFSNNEGSERQRVKDGEGGGTQREGGKEREREGEKRGGERKRERRQGH